MMSPLKSDRAQRIAAAIKQDTARSEMGKHPIVVGGTKQLFEVHKLPTALLAYNIRNGRFAAELKAKERELKRSLDPLLPEDEAVIRDLLLNIDPSATHLLKEDLKKVGQTDPGIITHDGFVINGNRRMAILQELHKAHPSGKFEYLEVQVLPKDIGDKDLWRIEAGLQLSRDKRLDYGPVNDLLKIREGLNAGLKPNEIAATLYGVKNAEEVIQKDERLKLIDTYLDFIGENDNYTKANAKVEHFINLQDFLRYLEKQGVKAGERLKWELVAFELIRANVTHMEIRKLRDIYNTEQAARYLVKTVRPHQGKREVKTEQTAEINTRDQLEVAKDYVQNQKDAKRPEALLDKAGRAIEILLKHKHDVVKRKDLHTRVKQLASDLQTLASECKGKK
jgi:hypothetical protein